ncbi:hypothetical protein CRE_05086 [Caenorhabditis remanei]|uniref:Core-2/I-Branching enzyme n=1 Tax=Caenorhabditis remanei TaxID=31234 RepID=E3MZ44_CAERE|nr:hypothetical protein CRE_05086 [Caenorhabditis remanei]
MIASLREENSDYCGESMNYCKRPETRHIQCGEVLKRDKTYLSSIIEDNRIPLIRNPSLNMSCPEISKRIRPKYNMSSLKLGGVAFARNVFTDYELIEKQVQMTWHPDNRYCFVVDKNAKDDFKQRIEQLVGCFEDQMVMPVTLFMDSAGHNQNLAHTKCMKALLQYPNWGYAMLLQNHDFITKTVYELDRIFDLMGGVIDVKTGGVIWERDMKHLKWDPKSLKLFRNESAVPEDVLKTSLTFACGSVQASLSRETVRWLIETADLTRFIDQQNQIVFGGDEQMISTFQINSQLGIPGHFTKDCLEQGVSVEQVTRLVHWSSTGHANCVTKISRHGVCLFGIEDLIPMAELPHLSFNKVYPKFDWSIIDCAAELVFNRTFLGQDNQHFDEDYYSNLVTVSTFQVTSFEKSSLFLVQYHKNHKKPGYKLNCTSNRKPRRYEDYIGS